MKKKKKIEIVVEDDKPTGVYRVDGGKWIKARGNIHLKKFVRKNTLSRKQGPYIYREMHIGIQRSSKGKADK